MGVVVNVVDGGRASDLKRFDENHTRTRDEVNVVLGGMCNGNAQAASDVIAGLRGRSISQLIFYGHGAPGIQGVTMGNRNGLAHKSGISNEIVLEPEFQRAWGALRSRFGQDGRVILRGCNSGQGPKGKALIVQLAKVFGVPVQASTWYQIVGRTNLVGTIRTAFPDGTVTEDKKSGLLNLTQLPLMEKVIMVGAEFLFDAAD